MSEDFPDPPVPVMPSTGARCRAAAVSIRWRAGGVEPIVLGCGDDPSQGAMVTPSNASGSPGCGGGSGWSQASTMELTMGASPMAWPSWGEKMRATP